MARRYHVSPLPAPGRAELPSDVAHHLVRVMRARRDERVVLFDGAGHECDARLVEVGGAGHRPRVQAEVEPARAATREPALRIEVVFPPPKGARAEWLFEHGTEVGIAAFRPVRTERSVAAPADRPERWLRILAAATGQCDRGRIPVLHAPRPLAECLADADLPAERYVAHGDAPHAPPLGAAQTTAAVLLVGPEGGLSAAELALVREHGFAPRSLGITTLRTETAVLAGAVRLLQHDTGTATGHGIG